MKKLLIALCASAIISLNTHAEEPLAIEANQPGFHQISPQIVTNLDFDKAQDEQVTTIAIKFSLMTDTKEEAELLKLHEPLYRSKVILFINQHRRSQLNSGQKKTNFRRQLKNIINQEIKGEVQSTNLVKRVLLTHIAIQ